MDYDEFRHAIESRSLPSIAEINARIAASLATAPPASAQPAEPSILSPISACLSQVDSGFGSPPFLADNDFVSEEDDVGAYDGDISGIELLDESFDEAQDGKSSGRVVCLSCTFVGRPSLVFVLHALTSFLSSTNFETST